MMNRAIKINSNFKEFIKNQKEKMENRKISKKKKKEFEK